MQIFIAEASSPNTSCQGYGLTASDSIKNLLLRWKDDYSATTKADPDFFDDKRDEMIVYEVSIGVGYVLGSHDAFARPVVARGSDTQFDCLFDPPLAAQGMKI